MALGQLGDLGFDAEQGTEEILEMRAEIDQQLRMILGLQRLGIGARGGQAGQQVRVRGFQMVEKGGVDTAEPRAVV